MTPTARHDPTGQPPVPIPANEVVDLNNVKVVGNGVQWTLREPRDLNVNLVSLDPRSSVGEHNNVDVDVLLVVLSGSGELMIGAQVIDLKAHVAAHVPKTTRRSVRAGEDGVVYLTVHRRRSPLGVTRRDSDPTAPVQSPPG